MKRRPAPPIPKPSKRATPAPKPAAPLKRVRREN